VAILTAISPMGVPLEHEIRAQRLLLRRLTIADVPRLHEIQSNWNVTRMLSLASFPPVLEDLRRWLSPHETEWTSGTAYRFAVISDAHVIGCADLDGIKARSGSLGYWLDEAAWGRGLASEAAAAVLNFARESLGLVHLRSGHAFDNPASGRVLTKLGFRWIGDADTWSRARQQMIVHRKYELTANL
jgi:RimJ/RimL family protein N-acetyltransferase